jgi:hypothetical protein
MRRHPPISPVPPRPDPLVQPATAPPDQPTGRPTRGARGSTECIAFRGFESGVVVGRIPLAPLKNDWFTVDMTFRIGDSGHARFIVRRGGDTLMVAQRGIDIWLGDRIRPKWGIYRSLSDGGQLQNCHLLLRNLRAYRGT